MFGVRAFYHWAKQIQPTGVAFPDGEFIVKMVIMMTFP